MVSYRGAVKDSLAECFTYITTTGAVLGIIKSRLGEVSCEVSLLSPDLV